LRRQRVIGKGWCGEKGWREVECYRKKGEKGGVMKKGGVIGKDWSRWKRVE